MTPVPDTTMASRSAEAAYASPRRHAGQACGTRRASWVLVAALACLVAPAPAQVVYRCVQKGKPVSLQSTPCAAGATATRAQPYTPEPTPTANDLAWKRYRTEREMAARNQAMRSRSSSGSAVVLPAGGDACARAKADRDAWERRVGLGRTIDGMRAWQEHVQRACR